MKMIRETMAWLKSLFEPVCVEYSERREGDTNMTRDAFTEFSVMGSLINKYALDNLAETAADRTNKRVNVSDVHDSFRWATYEAIKTRKDQLNNH